MAKDTIKLQARIEKEQAKLNATKARLDVLTSRAKSQTRKDETRLKILLGAWLLDSWKGSDSDVVLERVKSINAFYPRERDQELVSRLLPVMLEKDAGTK
jgi:hypothetical protein